MICPHFFFFWTPAEILTVGACNWSYRVLLGSVAQRSGLRLGVTELWLRFWPGAFPLLEVVLLTDPPSSLSSVLWFGFRQSTGWAGTHGPSVLAS